jgi:hypothetical protein
MRISIIDHGQWLDINSGPQARPRTSGIHLSGIITHIARLMGKLDREDDSLGFPLEVKLKMAMGLAWEDWLAAQYPHVEYHFGELEQDGILMSPDGLDLSASTLYEFKVTWKSAFKTLESYSDQWMWCAQNKGYLRPLGWRNVRQVILFVNGDYRPMMPELITLSIEYTQAEIDANWALMLQYKDAARPEVHTPMP